MEEAELLKERLQAITDKRKIQEEISQKRLKIEEEKLTHQHLKKKALRERWLLDGVGSGEEQEEMKRQNQQDQRQTQVLEQSILRLEKEIRDLERAELQISTNEEAILKKLKSIERTTEDIIRSVKVEKEETSEESIEDIYAHIPDLPKSYVPSRLRKERNDGKEDDEQNRKALYAMEIKVERDPKTGESTVLSSIPLPSDDCRAGVKVYDDGRRSVHAVGPGRGPALNGTAGLAPAEVEELLRQASERRSRSPTQFHEPVFANPFCRPATPQREKAPPGPNFHERIKMKANGLASGRDDLGHHVDNGLSEERGTSPTGVSPARPVPQPRSSTQRAETPRAPHQRLPAPWEGSDGTRDRCTPSPQARRSPREVPMGSSECQGPAPPHQEEEEDVRYNIVHSLPSDMDDAKPVTMIFMGYQQADDEEEKRLLTGYDGVIHAELVVIDEEEEGDGGAEKPSPHPTAPCPQVYQPVRPTPLPRKRTEVSPHENTHHPSPHKNSISLQEQEASLGSPACRSPLGAQMAGDGTEDPSLTALRMRMAKLGKKVI
ncbi:palmdelphin [Molossus molossus]|uniref:Palmdelphin n=2 Tax=Molossus molossus TaxID=27622 RepID=A0A7J8CSQ2_MOLMO|nr:palmdelphin [Molossus molossus]KAF6413901.1 palmdelphin [Molossus molossus]